MASGAKDQKFGTIPPSFELQQRTGGPLKPLAPQQINTVTEALTDLAGEMEDWIRTDLNRLTAARNAFLENMQSQEHIGNLHRASHDLKGLGQTYGFPIVSVIADTLCKAIVQTMEKGAVPEDLVNAHVDALRAVVNLNLRDVNSSPALELLSGLNKLMNKKTA